MGQLGGESLPQDRGGQDLNDEEKRKVLTPSDFFFFKQGKHIKLFFLFLFFTALYSMQDLSSLTGHWICAACSGSVESQPLAREVPYLQSWLLLRLIMEKAMAPHSSTLAWKIPWKEEPGRLQSMGLLRVGHDWATSLSLFPFMHWRRKWQPTPVFLPWESQGQGCLVGCCLWGRTESDTTEAT